MQPKWAKWRSEVDRDVLGLEELLDAPMTALAAEPGLLDATERRADVRDQALVQADHAGLEPFAHAQRALDVTREDICDQTELGVVGGGDGLVLVGEVLDRGD